MGTLVDAARNAYTLWRSEEWPSTPSDWSSLTDSQVGALYRTDMNMRKDIDDALATEKNFFTLRDTDIKNLVVSQKAVKAARVALWKAREENGYDPTYNPP
ncbi:MAG: hypothetical protein BWY47_00043 [Bacteroidetes bacterium ADurb.Bin302]|nr:MAG: hypothetical protein BWY47_00043 [Bacteroidetes bacterium ADurb.Bin302]